MSCKYIIVEERKRRYLSLKNYTNKISGRPRIDNSFFAIISIIFIQKIELFLSLSTKAIRFSEKEELTIEIG